MKRELKLNVTKEYTTGGNAWVECVDASGMAWNLSRMAYNKLKYVGMPFATPEATKRFYDVLAGRDYKALPIKERKAIMIQCIESFFSLPINSILPRIGELDVR